MSAHLSVGGEHLSVSASFDSLATAATAGRVTAGVAACLAPLVGDVSVATGSNTGVLVSVPGSVHLSRVRGTNS